MQELLTLLKTISWLLLLSVNHTLTVLHYNGGKTSNCSMHAQAIGSDDNWTTFIRRLMQVKGLLYSSVEDIFSEAK